MIFKVSAILMSALSSAPVTTTIPAAAARGAFILFEGIDRCGKTTQTAILKDNLSKVTTTEGIRFPDRQSSIGQVIDSYLQSKTELNDKAIHLLFSANRWEASANLERKLAAGCTLVCDRYCYSGVAFSSAKGIDRSWCKSCDKGLPAPDCIIYLDLTVNNASQRGNYGEERYERVDFQSKVQEQFMSLKSEDEAAGTVPWHVVDATGSIEAIQSQIQKISEETIARVADKPINKLWL